MIIVCGDISTILKTSTESAWFEVFYVNVHLKTVIKNETVG